MSLPLIQSGGGSGGAAGVTSITGDGVTTGNSASAGAVTLTQVAQAKNKFLAGPTSGANANPTFRVVDPLDFPVLNASHLGGFFSDGEFGMGNILAPAAGAPAIAATTLYAMQFVLPCAMTIGHATIQTGAGVAASWMQFGIYDKSGNRLIDTGQFATTSGPTKLTNSFTTVTLPPGVYYFAWEASTITTLTVQGKTFTADVAMALANFLAGNTAFGSCSNAASGGILPATLGTITGIVSGLANLPLVYWEF